MDARLSRPTRYCAWPKCGVRVSSGYCVDHAKTTYALDRAERGSSRERGYDTKWDKFSKHWRQQYPLCGQRPEGLPPTGDSQCQLAGVVTLGELVDHITPLHLAPDRKYDEQNLQTLCSNCHNLKTLQEGGRVYTIGKRYVIVGPPGCGKTTWVQQHARKGDVVYDLDVLAGVMSQMPTHPRPTPVVTALLAMRDGLIAWLERVKSPLNVFIIVTKQDEGTLIAQRIGAQLVQPRGGGMRNDANFG